MNRNLLLLALAQGAFLTNNVVFIAINGLVGLALAPFGWMATLPITAYVLGSALSTQIVARTQRAWGRQRSFQWGLLVGFISTLICAWGAHTRQFTWVVAGTLMAGFYSANASLYRFAAPELVTSTYREKAISWVMAGGILGAVIGPNLAQWSRSIRFDTVTTSSQQPLFVGSYLALAGIAVIGFAIVSCIQFAPITSGSSQQQGRGVRELMHQPAFVIAIVCGALGYGIMNLLMSATPIAMQVCGLDFPNAALVLEWHVLGMFVPSFFTGNLIKRFGVMKILWAGMALNALCVVLALSGNELHNFLLALFTLGVGWNFLYVGGTALLTQNYRPEERTQAQAAMDFCVFATMAVSSFSSGALINQAGWQWLNWGSMLPLVACGVGLVYLGRNSRP